MAERRMPHNTANGKFYVYIYRDPRPGKNRCPVYVGKGKTGTDRADRHWRKGSHNKCLRSILDKVRANKLEPIIEIVFWTDSETTAFEKERELVSLFGRRDIKTGTLANVTDGGEGVSGWPATKEYRDKKSAETRRRFADMSDSGKLAWRAAHKKAVSSESHRKRLSASHTGKKESDETRQKKRLAATGRRHSDETKAKLSANAKNRTEEHRKRLSEANAAVMSSPNRKALTGSTAKRFWASMSPEQKSLFVSARAAKIVAAKKAKALIA